MLLLVAVVLSFPTNMGMRIADKETVQSARISNNVEDEDGLVLDIQLTTVQ
jgi:hypothetical protein